MDIYLVAVYKEKPHGVEYPFIHRPRTWGWYQNFEDAERAVLENRTDMFEICYYDRAVIERMPEGVAQIAEDVAWYRADYDVDSNDPVVVRMDKPQYAEGFFNFTL